MVKNTNEDTRRTAARQDAKSVDRRPIKIGAATPYDFAGSNMTAYGGLLPLATMLEKLEFEKLIKEHVTIRRVTSSMPGCRFVLAMVLALYVGFSRLNHLQFLQREPMLTGILNVTILPVQSTFWRFLTSLHLTAARQLLEVTRHMRQRVWQAANVRLKAVTLDTDTTVQTVYGRHMGARKGYNPKRRGKKSYQPILTFMAETREYISGELRKGVSISGKQITAHLDGVFGALPNEVEIKAKPEAQSEQYQLFDGPQYTYRVFVTNLDAPIDVVVGFYRERAGAENLIKEANNDAGLAAHPSIRWAANCVHFQLAMLAYNLNCWLMLFHRDEQVKADDLHHTTIATARLRFLFLAAKIVRHAGSVLVRYSDHYAEKGSMARLMDRLHAIAPKGSGFAPVLATALRL
jgi:hypothetical protein